MKIVLFIFVGLLLIFLLLLFPLKLAGKFVLDIESKSLYYSLKGGGLNLSAGKIYLLENFSFSLINQSIFFMNIKQPNIDKNILMVELFKRMKIKKVLILTDAGIQRDAFITSMIIGSMNVIFESLSVGAKRKGIEYEIHGEPIYDDSNLNIAGEMIFSITFLKLITALIISKHKSKETKGEEKYV